jgi:hypothetical protein
MKNGTYNEQLVEFVFGERRSSHNGHVAEGVELTVSGTVLEALSSENWCSQSRGCNHEMMHLNFLERLRTKS